MSLGVRWRQICALFNGPFRRSELVFAGMDVRTDAPVEIREGQTPRNPLAAPV
jgi:hypothetical protein